MRPARCTTSYQVADIAVMLLASVAGRALVAAVLGLLLAKYRDIFFAMLSLAFSMILFGLLVKSSELGSTDGFGLPRERHWPACALARGLGCATPSSPSAVVAAFVAAWGMHRYLELPPGPAGRRDPRQRAARGVHGRLGAAT